MAVEGEKAPAHLPNSGRMTELLVPGAKAYLSPAPPASVRKTAWDLTMIEYRGLLVSVDSRLPGALLDEAIRAAALPEFGGFKLARREVVFEDSRIDLLLSGEPRLCYLEAKSVNLVEGRTALFPDAPTERGRKHLDSLARAARQGHRAAVAFVVQRSDARELSPHRRADPVFCDALQEAVENGVEAYSYRCRVSRREIAIVESVPVKLA